MQMSSNLEILLFFAHRRPSSTQEALSSNSQDALVKSITWISHCFHTRTRGTVSVRDQVYLIKLCLERPTFSNWVFSRNTQIPRYSMNMSLWLILSSK